jgi:hypothetical protein
VAELVILTPVVVMFALAALSFGRLSEAQQQVVESARSGAQAAAVMPSAAGAQWAASANAVIDLFDRTHTCAESTITADVTQFQPGGSVEVTVKCQVDLSDIVFPGLPGTMTVQSTAAAPIDPYRSVQ